MTAAPENIWAHPTERQPISAKLKSHAPWLRGKFKNHNSKAHGDVQYTRTEIHDAVVAEREAEIARLRAEIDAAWAMAIRAAAKVAVNVLGVMPTCSLGTAQEKVAAAILAIEIKP